MAISNYKNMKAPSTCTEVICLAINCRGKEAFWGGKVGILFNSELGEWRLHTWKKRVFGAAIETDKNETHAR